MISFLSDCVLPLLVVSTVIACGGSSGGGSSDGGTKYVLSVGSIGTGSGRVTSNPQAGIDCGSTCSISLDAGASVTLTAAAAAGSDFSGWSGSCSGTGPCTLAMDGNKTVTSRFTSSRVTFQSQRKIDGTDAANANGTSNIWRVNGDGTGLVALTRATADGAGNSFPEWSPDGQKIVFYSSRKLDGTDAPNVNFTRNVWRVNGDGTGLMPLTTATANGVDNANPTWSLDGTRVAFHSSRKLDGTDAPNLNFTNNIWRVNSDGTALRIITNSIAANVSNLASRWSPDGAKVVFVSTRKVDGSDAPGPNRTFNIWSANADGTGLLLLTNATYSHPGHFANEDPKWSPDGTQIAFSCSRKLDGTDAPNLNLTFNIWRVNADGMSLRIVTNSSATGTDNSSPQWSPDGTKILFTSSRKLDGTDAPNANGVRNVWLVNADGTGLTPLTQLTALGTNVSGQQWSPDGTKIVFNSSRKLDGSDAPNVNTTFNIWRMNADGTGLMPLTTATASGAHSFLPSFSP